MTPRVLRRPAAPRSRVRLTTALPRSRPSRRRQTTMLLVDTNQPDEHDCRLFLDVAGGLVNLSTYGISFLAPRRLVRAMYQVHLEYTSEDDCVGTGVDGVVLQVQFVKWIGRAQYDAIASQIGGHAW